MIRYSDQARATFARGLAKVVSIRDNMVKNIKYGGGGGTTLYNLTVSREQCSFHNIWIETGPPDHISMIVAGWSGDGYRDGCYNVLCPGFVQVHRTITTNFPLQPASVYGGQQYELIMYIQQDMYTGNWWLNVFYPPIPVGYWPKELFLNLRNGSLHIAWGGIGLAGSDGVCPPMGSGHKPDGDYTHAACFRGLHWTSSLGTFYTPRKEAEWVDKSNVYDLKNDHYLEKMGDLGQELRMQVQKLRN
ncbi:uncharacterized protein LOC115740582 [Rhodamnia argentea]|uniref:Uncharacterized protein LOC115740582 n=1 Tax=Rhodamnia argentea TaxID=178133 RepID=A0ABM3HBR8_9MYRT|nr:uncharacterized protein LOC115740582 [Rhodamnia argentea]